MRPFLAALLMVAATVLAGCSSGGSDDPVEGGLDVTDTTGGIRGIVVDQAVVPVAGAEVTLAGGRSTTSGEDGTFNFTGLAPGEYFLAVGKAGFQGAQVTATVVAGVPDPPIVKVLLERLSTAQPYLDFFKLDGFYECAHALFFVTDTCDWVPRTGWDTYNESQGSPPPAAPRSALRYYNTQYIDVPADTYGIIQEAFWESEQAPVLWIMIDETPIDAGCDCSDSYSNVVGESPTYNRLDRFLPDGAENTEFRADLTNGDEVGKFPAGQRVAVRGFIPFAESPSDSTDPNTWAYVATNLSFTVITSLFHNYVPQDGWTFETKDQYPVG